VGSAWVDTERRDIHLGVSVFPAGVDEQEGKRGAPKNQTRRQKRSQRRNIARRAKRKRRLRSVLTEAGLLPRDPNDRQRLFRANRWPVPEDEEQYKSLLRDEYTVWDLRRDASSRQLSPYEFGRVLVHLGQRRGAMGLNLPVEEEADEDDSRATTDEKKKARKAWDNTQQLMKEHHAKTFGELMAVLMKKRQSNIDANGRTLSLCEPIRNRRNLLVDKPENAVFATRELIHEEFNGLWNNQKEFGGELGGLLTDSLKARLDDPTEEKPWRYKGDIFGQRLTYWRTPDRCDLEPAERRCPIADMYAQEFRVMEMVNNIRIKGPLDGDWRPLNREAGGEREKVVLHLRGEGGQTIPTVRKAKKHPKNKQSSKEAGVQGIRRVLGIDKRTLNQKDLTEDAWQIKMEEKDPDRKINTDWFHREIVLGVFTKPMWGALTPQQRDSVNRAILRFDPEDENHGRQLHDRAVAWWGLACAAADRLVEAWRKRPKLERRVNLSRRAIRNLLPYLRDGLTVTEARQRFAEDEDAIDQATGKPPTVEQRALYAFSVTNATKERLLSLLSSDPQKVDEILRPLKNDEKQALIGSPRIARAVSELLRRRGTNYRARHYMRKHGVLLPPAPMLANPVVRKAIHEVRRHILSHMNAHRNPETGEPRRPDRIVIELARSARQSGKVRQAILDRNRAREAIRESIIQRHKLANLSANQQKAAVDRVLLCRQQRYVCPYSGLVERDKGIDPYAGKVITEDQAAQGNEVEIDHIVPYSKCGDDSLNNKVLCYRTSNRGKGSQILKNWLGGEQSHAFQALEQRLRHICEKAKPRSKKRDSEESSDRNKDDKADYFSRKDYKRKWENLHRMPSLDEFRSSQLTDTAYAAKQAGEFLRAVLYDGEADGRRRVFFTKGSFTGALRKDWRLFQRLPRFRPKGQEPAPEERQIERQQFKKDRRDHRHHAIDALVIALTLEGPPGSSDDYLQHLSRQFEEIETKKEQYKQAGVEPPQEAFRRRALPPPWPSGDVNAFRRQVLSKVYADFDVMDRRFKGVGLEGGEPLVVSHRPERRKIVGKFHEDTAYGPVLGQKTKYTCRVDVTKLRPGYLKLSEAQRQALAEKRKPKPTDDPAIDPNSYLVRDLRRRLEIRKCLREGCTLKPEYAEKKLIEKLNRGRHIDPPFDVGGTAEELRTRVSTIGPRLWLDPDDFTRAEIQLLVKHGAIHTRSNIPIKSVVCVRTIINPAVIPPKNWDQTTSRPVPDPDPRTHRAYLKKNNHHIEIRERTKTRKAGFLTEWVGKPVPMFDAARRNAARLKALREAGVPTERQWRRLPRNERRKFHDLISDINTRSPLVDRSDNDDGGFVMSLAIGETVHMRRPKSSEPGYFVVFKIDPTGTIHFKSHWDARSDKGEKDTSGSLIEESRRADVRCSARQLRDLGPEPGQPPYKVRVSPLGEVTRLDHD
jgi:CRISPR-associated endonuclease Csn1